MIVEQSCSLTTSYGNGHYLHHILESDITSVSINQSINFSHLNWKSSKLLYVYIKTYFINAKSNTLYYIANNLYSRTDSKLVLENIRKT